jgi:enoyl-CoA hydratase
MRLAAAAGKAHDSTSFRNAPANRSMFDIAHEGDVAILRMAHGKANAMNIELCSALSQYLAEFRTSQARALVITGTGGIFSAGVDLLRLSEGGASYVRKFLPALNAMFAATFSFPKPIVAAINGHAIAGGMEMVQGTDIRVSCPEAKFGVQEVKWAIFPAGGSTVRLPAQLPFAKAMELLLTGDLISADEAKDIGFLNYVVPADQVMTKAMEIAEKIAANGPIAVKAIRKSARACLGVPEREALKIESEISGPVFQTEDAKEGPAAFMQKRKPAYKGR